MAEFDFFRVVQENTVSWSPMGGRAYLASSEMGLNSAFGEPVRYENSSKHQLEYVDQFRDFMNSRMQQAQELADDLSVYRGVYAEHPEVKASPEGKALAKAMAERYMMAMYGISEHMHKKEIGALYSRSGEKAYEQSQTRVAESIHRPDGEEGRMGVGYLIKRLEGFANTWSEISSRERVAALNHEWLASHGQVDMVAFVSGAGGDADELDQAIYTEEFLYRYLAENLGRNQYFMRSREALNGAREGGMDISVSVNDYDVEAVCNRIRRICRNEDNMLGIGDEPEACALDGERIVELAISKPDSSEDTRSVGDEWQFEPFPDGFIPDVAFDEPVPAVDGNLMNRPQRWDDEFGDEGEPDESDEPDEPERCPSPAFYPEVPDIVIPGPAPEISPGPARKVTPGPDPEVIPEPDPEVIPGLTPEVTPGADPEVIPGLVPEVIPEPDSEVIPGPVPEVMPPVRQRRLDDMGFEFEPDTGSDGFELDL